jgi:hypothetical protein
MGYKVLELYAGTGSLRKAFEAQGHEVYSIDWDDQHPNIDWHTDIGKVTAQDIIDRFGYPDIIWASPDCTTYSIAAISHHRYYEDGFLKPRSEYAKQCDAANENLMKLIKDLNPKYWFIENPRGGMRKMHFVQGLPRYTVTYCQYGDTRMKPTDIFTNHNFPMFAPMCRPKAPCHRSAPRGSKTGTQGLAKVDRSVIPQELCNHIVSICI